jgi:VIT1/CCC1 family predicted Fe2+/Mn2+ transporter
VFGFPFSLKLMELGEEKAQSNYAGLRRAIPEIETWIRDEETHEQALMEMLDEDRLHYDGSVVLGLNEVLVALCGVLAILTLALQNTKMIALSGWITGIAAAIAMAVSEFMFRRSEKSCRHPLRAATQVGLMYVLMVTFLVSPYWLFENIYLDLGLALGIALSIIAICYAYISVAKDEPFRRGFFEMAGLSLGLAGVLFPLGYLIRVCLGIEP